MAKNAVVAALELNRATSTPRPRTTYGVAIARTRTRIVSRRAPDARKKRVARIATKAMSEHPKSSVQMLSCAVPERPSRSPRTTSTAIERPHASSARRTHGCFAMSATSSGRRNASAVSAKGTYAYAAKKSGTIVRVVCRSKNVRMKTAPPIAALAKVWASPPVLVPVAMIAASVQRTPQKIMLPPYSHQLVESSRSRRRSTSRSPVFVSKRTWTECLPARHADSSARSHPWMPEPPSEARSAPSTASGRSGKPMPCEMPLHVGSPMLETMPCGLRSTPANGCW